MERISEDEARGGKRGLAVWLSAIVFFLVMYPLSFGPVVKCGIVPERVLFYKPLVLLYANSAIVTRFYDWYLFDVWKVK